MDETDGGERLRGTITGLLGQLGNDPQAVPRLVDAVYDDIKRIAIHRLQLKMGAPLRAITLAPTHVAHEAILQLLQQHTQWKNRQQFFAIAARMVGRAIREHRRTKQAIVRGGREAIIALPENAGDLLEDGREVSSSKTNLPLELDELLDLLREESEMEAEVFTLKLVCNHTHPEIAKMLNVSLSTVERSWREAKGWFAKRLAAP